MSDWCDQAAAVVEKHSRDFEDGTRAVIIQDGEGRTLVVMPWHHWCRLEPFRSPTPLWLRVVDTLVTGGGFAFWFLAVVLAVDYLLGP